MDAFEKHAVRLKQVAVVNDHLNDSAERGTVLRVSASRSLATD
jgi:hypothetical protein